MTTLLFDLECDGFKPTEIFIVGVIDCDTEEYTAYTGDRIAEGLIRCSQADRCVGHNLKGFDIPQIQRLTNGLITFDLDKVDDTLEISKALFPDIKKHSLEFWGDILGSPKLEQPRFDRFTSQMAIYCEQDVRLNKMLYDFFLTQL